MNRREAIAALVGIHGTTRIATAVEPTIAVSADHISQEVARKVMDEIVKTMKLGRKWPAA